MNILNVLLRHGSLKYQLLISLVQIQKVRHSWCSVSAEILSTVYNYEDLFGEIIFTDDSKLDNKVGCTCFSSGRTYLYGLSSASSIFIAELYVILKGLGTVPFGFRHYLFCQYYFRLVIKSRKNIFIIVKSLRSEPFYSPVML